VVTQGKKNTAPKTYNDKAVHPSYYLTFIILPAINNTSIIHNLSFYDLQNNTTVFYEEVKVFLHFSKPISFIGTLINREEKKP
jgi:hypothetical protein